VKQTKPSTWDVANGWVNRPGFWEHSWNKHEGYSGRWFASLSAAAPAGARSLALKSTHTASGELPIGSSSDIEALRAGTYLIVRNQATQQNVRVRATGRPTAGGGGIYELPVEALVFDLADDSRLSWGDMGNLREFSFGLSIDRGGSPWMSALLAEFFWSYFWLVPDSDPTRAVCAAVLYELGWGIESYAFDSRYVNGTFERKSTHADAYTSRRGFSPWFRPASHARVFYYMSQHLSVEAETNANFDLPGPDQHAPEVSQMLAYAYFFERDQSRRSQLRARIGEVVKYHWSDPQAAKAYNTTYIRLVSWRDRASPYRTWQWVETHAPTPH
jgi:hypothetical protein